MGLRDFGRRVARKLSEAILPVYRDVALHGGARRPGSTVDAPPEHAQAPSAQVEATSAQAPSAQVEVPSEKACNRCGRVQPLDAFYRMSRYPDGRRPTCKDCMIAERHAKRSRELAEVELEVEPEVEPAPDGHLRCCRCFSIKPLSSFYVDRSKATGRRPSCKVCDREARPKPAHIPEGHRRCPKCRQMKPEDLFAGQRFCPDCFQTHVAGEEARLERRRQQKRLARSRLRESREVHAQAVLAAGRKVCARCEADKPLDAFPRRPLSVDGRAGVCSVCVAATRGHEDPEDFDRVLRWQNRQKELLGLVQRVED